ncbi:hypothetical protein [Paenibacillus sp. NEAU-GSW1]|uniref:hypothetical protein n=1 Tax=Paenibacillus sp. NEAU-GSW1 TaxID=2682486 RepID=UPI001C12A44B|nr:hypothetical protein [Paenibacillus sp. NEAU-GSW1]
MIGNPSVFALISKEVSDVNVNNLAPDTRINYKTEKKQRKTDLLVDLRNTELQKAEVEQLINEQVVPKLKNKDLDYKISYVAQDEAVKQDYRWIYGRHDLFIMIDGLGRIYEAVGSDNSDVKLTHLNPPVNVVQAYGIGTYRYYIDQDGFLYDSDFVRLNGISNVKSMEISSSGRAIFVVNDLGELWVKGTGTAAELGLNTVTSAAEFTQISSIPQKVVKLFANGATTGKTSFMALTDTGEVYAWGTNTNGTLGIGTLVDQKVPVKIEGLPKIETLSVGLNQNTPPYRFASYFIDTDGGLWMAQDKSDGKIKKVNTSLTYKKVFSTYLRTVLLSTNNEVYVSTDSTTLASTKPSFLNVADVLASSMEGQFLRYTNGVTTPEAGQPIRVKDVAISPDGKRQSFVALDGSLIVRTRGDEFKEAYDLRTNNKIINIEKVFSTPYTDFAIDRNGDVYGWGTVFDGERTSSPIKIGLKDVKQITGFDNRVYAVLENGDVYAWSICSSCSDFVGVRESGDVDVNGLLGQYEGKQVWYKDFTRPAKIKTLSGIVKIVPSDDKVFAVTKAGELYGWGLNEDKSYITLLGVAANVRQLTPVLLSGIADVADFDYVRNTSFANFAMAVLKNGEVYAWGYSSYMLFGQSVATSKNPIIIPGLQNIKSISISNGQAVAIDANHQMWAWGNPLHEREVSSNVPQKSLLETVAKAVSVRNSVAIIGPHNVLFAYGIRKEDGIADVSTGTVKVNETTYVVSTNATLGQVYSKATDSFTNWRSTVKEYKDVIGSHAWRDGSDKYYIALDEQAPYTMMDDRLFAQTMSVFLDKNIRLIGVGSNASESILRKMIDANNNQGLYFDTADLTASFKRMGTYIVKNTPIDVHFNMQVVQRDTYIGLEEKFEQIVRPALLTYGIDANMTINRGVANPESRLFYVSTADNKLYVYDPAAAKSSLYLDKPITNFAIAQDGSIIYSDSTGLYQYDEYKMTNTKISSVRPSKFILDFKGNVYYAAYNQIYKIDNNTGLETALNMACISTMVFSTNYKGQPMFRCETEEDDWRFDLLMTFNEKTGQVEQLLRQVLEISAASWNNESGQFIRGSTGGYERLGPAYMPLILGSFSDNPTGVQNNSFAYAYTSRFDSRVYMANKGIYIQDPVRNISKYIETWTATSNTEVLFAETPDGKMYYKDAAGTYKYYDPETDSVVSIGNLPIKRSAVIDGVVNYPQGLPIYQADEMDLLQDLKEHSWRTGADHFYVNLTNTTSDDLADEVKRYQVEDELFSYEASYIGMGTGAIKEETESMVETVKYGTYIDGTDIDLALAKLAQYLIEQAGVKRTLGVGKVVLEYDPETSSYSSDKMIYETTYEDKESDVKIADRWRFDHDSDYYENSLGTFEQSGMELAEPLEYFTKPGKYTIVWQGKDNPKDIDTFEEYRKWSNELASKLIIYAHRRPIARFTVKTTPSESNSGNFDIKVNETSYDLDRLSTENSGIAEERWKWKGANDTEWTPGPIPSTLPADQVYYISLIVRDTDNAWSDEVVQSIFTSADNQPPVALFTIEPSVTSKNGGIAIVDYSSDPNDDPIAEWVWKVKRNGNVIFMKNKQTPPTFSEIKGAAASADLSELGIYTITLEVKDEPKVGMPLWSNVYSRTLQIVNSPPTAAVTFPTGTLNNPTLTAQKPTIEWVQSDEDAGTEFSAYQVQVLDQTMTSLLYDSGIQSQHTAAANGDWRIPVLLSSGEPLAVRVRVKDETDWSNWSVAKYMIFNRAPIGDFDWTPKPVYEGDTVRLSASVADPDGDPLDVTFKMIPPPEANGDNVRTYSYKVSEPYSLDPPTLQLKSTGAWKVVMTVSDGMASAVTIAKTIAVLPLRIDGFVKHTPKWEANRIAYNMGQSGSASLPRAENVFWAGEKFVLEADTTLTATDTVAERVEAEMNGFQSSLVPVNEAGTSWTGEMWDDSFEKLEDGPLTFTFTVYYSNGTIKTDTAVVEIAGTIYDYYQIHRVK